MSHSAKSRSWWLAAGLVAVLALSACLPTPPAPPSLPAPAPVSSGEEIVTAYVGPVLVDCVGVAPQKCLLIRFSPDTPYQFFYDNIKGFEYEEGYNYELLVKRTPLKNVPADASAISTELVEVVSKLPAGEISTLYVAPMMVECETTEVYQCLLVADSPEGEYKPFYGKILNFEYEEGYQYALLVEKLAADQPPADAPAGVWDLLAITQKQPADAVMPGASAEASPLEGTQWNLISYVNAQGETVGVLEGTRVTAAFQGGRMVGNAGCNNYTAEYSVKEDSLVIGMAASTMMACTQPGVMEQEAAYLLALPAVATFEIADDTLTLFNADDQAILIFAAATPVTLTGTTWQVTAYNNGRQAVVGLLADTTITMVFDAEGRVSGNSGCNNFTGSYTVDGAAIQVGQLASTMRMCVEPEGVMEQEAEFLAALQSAAMYDIRDDQMQMRTAEDALALTAVVQAAEAAEEMVETVSLEGPQWLLQSYVNDAGEFVEPVAGTEVTATFKDGRVSGNASCNTYGAGYTLDGNALTFGPAVSTMMMCQPEAVAQQEQAFMAALAAVASYQIEGDALVLSDAGGNPLLTFAVFTPAPLAGTNWTVSFYNNGKEALVSAIAGTEIVMLFGEDGSVSGNAGCNNFMGSYTVDGDAIQVGPLASTMMMCAEPQGVMEQETLFLAALQSAATFAIQGNDLEMRDAEGTRVVTAAVATASAEPELVGQAWAWQALEMSDGAVTPVNDPTRYTIEFLADGTYQLKADCNTGGGSYTVDGASLAIGPARLTRMACPPDSMDNMFLTRLEEVATYVIQDGTLYLNLKMDSGNMVFVPLIAE